MRWGASRMWRPKDLVLVVVPRDAARSPRISANSLRVRLSRDLAVCFNLLWRSASRNGRLLHENHDRDAVRHVTESYRYGPLWYVVALALEFVSVTASLLLNLALAIYFALPSKTAAAISTRHPERQLN